MLINVEVHQSTAKMTMVDATTKLLARIGEIWIDLIIGTFVISCAANFTYRSSELCQLKDTYIKA